jgi:hypothetical protein
LKNKLFWLWASLSGVGGAIVVLSFVALLFALVTRHIGEGYVGDSNNENRIIFSALAGGLLAFVTLPMLATGRVKQARLFACYFAIAFSFLAPIALSIRYFVLLGGS